MTNRVVVARIGTCRGKLLLTLFFGYCKRYETKARRAISIRADSHSLNSDRFETEYLSGLVSYIFTFLLEKPSFL